MVMGKVVGHVVSTRKNENMVGSKILEIQLMENGKMTDKFLVAIDSVGAGIGEYVLVTQGSSARLALMIGAVIWVGIVVGFGNFKFMPMQDAIMQYFNIAEGAYGYLNTASGWIILICAIPMGFLVRKLPCNISVTIGFNIIKSQQL